MDQRITVPMKKELAAAALALTGLFLTAPGSTLGADTSQAARHTNIVLIYIDNVGYGDLACYGNRTVRTPHLDRLAAEGVRCTDFYVTTSSCTPSRAALLTGRYPVRNGLTWQLRAEESFAVGLRHSELLLPHFLKRQGYATACFGKWNIGFGPGSRPTERGFDEYFGHASGNIDYYTHIYNGRNDLFRGTQAVEVEGYSTDLFADAACDFIGRHARRPFFVYLAFNAAHYTNPRNQKPGEPVIWQVPAEYLQLYGYPADEPDEKRRYHAVLTALDAGIGRVVERIDALGLRANTLVLVISDNGAFMLKARGLEVASNLPLRDGGTTVYEGGVRVPCVVRWPGHFKPGTVCREPLSHLDVFPLALRAAGAPLPTDRVLDGRDPTAALAGEAPTPHQHLFFQYGKWSGVRGGRYKLVRPDPGKPFELYDLAEDLGETNDLAAAKPEVAADLRRAFERWLAAVRQEAAQSPGQQDKR